MNSDYCMPRPDYQQTIIHHSHLLVLLCGVGPSKPRSLQKLFDKVRRIDHLKITDSNGLVRDIWLRYIHDHPVENNDWGDFQTHRRLLGLITIGKFDTQHELNELCRQHESLKVRYGTTLYESRAIFLGPASNQIPNHIPAAKNTNNDTNDTNDIDERNEKCSKVDESFVQTEIIETTKQMRLQDEFTTPQNFKARALFYRENESYDDLDEHMIDFITALFWILESKRLERSREKVEKCNLLTAPFESREVVGLNMESRNNRKRILGRITKNLADLSLQAGLIEDALSLYHSAYDMLKSIMDSLWVGATEEGLCSASACLLYPHLRTEQTITNRKASLQIGSPQKNTPEKYRNDNNVNQCILNSMAKTIPDQLEPKTPPPLSSSNSSVSSILTHSTLSQSSTNSSSASTSLTTTTTHGRSGHCELPGNILKAEELPIYFQRAIINYSKYRHAAIVEIEASFKSARISVEQNRSLDVAMVLQNILFINHSLTEQERIRIFEVITSLFEQIGYRRKAAFFQRLAALKHLQNTPRPDLLQTYRLLFNSMSGYMLSPDPLEVLQNKSAGWPALQINLLQYLITTANRLGHSTLATRHMTFLLQTQWPNMSAKEQSEMALQLQNYSAQCEGSPVPLVLENGTIIPPANLTDLPYCLQMIVKDLPPHLKPQRLKTAIADKGPFLFTPLQFNTIERKDKSKERNKIAFYWVQNNRSEITIRLQNPLPFELIINDMRLLTKGVVFKTLAQSLTMQPNQITWVSLYGTPLEAGELDIQGYSTHTLGVKSNCRLKHMFQRKFPPNYFINILPDLPCITVKTSLPQTASFSSSSSSSYCSNIPNKDIVVTTASLTLYHGASSTCVISITNESSVPVEHFEVIITSNVQNDLQTQIFHINHDDIQSKLPIAAQSTIDFELNIFAEANFIQSHCNLYAFNCNNSCSTADSLTNHTSLPVRIGIGDDNAASKRNQSTYSSFRSTNSSATAAQLSGTLSLPQTNSQANGESIQQQIDAQLLLKYSGGECMQDGFCRQCAIYVKLEFLPSVQITNWDVLPAEIPSQFYLVLDLTNLTNQEMSLNYTNGKTIVIEAQENCRVPVPVERCPLDEISAATATLFTENLEKDLCDRSPLISYDDIVSDLCSKHIADRVEIHWLLTGTDIKGLASLKGITLTQAMIDLCSVSPLLWNISFKNQTILPQSEVVCIAGQKSELSISICNQSLHPLRNLILTIKFYQDYLNGIQNFNLDTRVAISGPNRLLIPLLQRNEELRHECTVIFFTPGRFKASIQCHTKRQPLVNTTKPYLLTRSCPVPQQQQQQHNDHHSIMTTERLSRSLIHRNSEDHIWKFIPPIEVTVLES